MLATAQRFSELHPNVEIQWRARSLQEFAEYPIEELAKRFDLLVIDHPSVGRAAELDALLPLDDYLPRRFLENQAQNSVGRSHESYRFAGHQWALAIDAAAPVSGWRSDLLMRAGADVPQTWTELLDLARRGLVAVPGLAIDSLMNFYMLCGALGEEPFELPGRVIDPKIGIAALQMLRELLSLCNPECFNWNPIAVWQHLSAGDAFAYCPFAYGYSNYTRLGYSEHAIDTGGLVKIDGGRVCRSTLGGAGLAISMRCQDREAAVQYTQYVAGAECQGTIYFDSGGQPGYRGAWLDSEVNRRCNNFFESTLPTLDAAYLRPRFNGYLAFQDAAGPLVHRFLREGGPEKLVLNQMNRMLEKFQIQPE
jgi:multiple sugar transport system substrate-binding protein